MRKLLTRAIQDWNLEHYAALYGKGKLSMAKVAEGAGATLWEFQNYLREHNIPAQYDRCELDHDVKMILAKE